MRAAKEEKCTCYHPGGRTPPSTRTRVQSARPLLVSTERCMSSVMKNDFGCCLLVRVRHGVDLLHDVETSWRPSATVS